MTKANRAKIAIFMPNLEGGGAERVMATLADGFTARGFAVDLVLASAHGECLETLGSAVRVVNLGRRRVFTSLFPLRSYLRRERPDVLLSALSHANVIALLANRFAGRAARVIVSERTSFYSVQEYNRGLAYFILGLAMRATYWMADAITVVSEPIVTELAEALRLDHRFIHYVPNPIVSGRIAALAAAPSPHDWLEDGGPPVILGVGRLSSEKGFDILIRAFARVVSERPARLIIFGKGPMRTELEQLVAHLEIGTLVALPGFIQNPYAAMSRASAFVLPSRFEGMPGALIQAMACGVPVVSTDCRTGPREVLEGGRWGRLVPVDDETTMSEAIIATLDQKAHPPVANRATMFDEHHSVSRHLEVMGLAEGDQPANIS